MKWNLVNWNFCVTKCVPQVCSPFTCNFAFTIQSNREQLSTFFCEPNYRNKIIRPWIMGYKHHLAIWILTVTEITSFHLFKENAVERIRNDAPIKVSKNWSFFKSLFENDKDQVQFGFVRPESSLENKIPDKYSFRDRHLHSSDVDQVFKDSDYYSESSGLLDYATVWVLNIWFFRLISKDLFLSPFCHEEAGHVTESIILALEDFLETSNSQRSEFEWN